MSFEPASNHIYVAHSERFDVVDLSAEKVIGQVAVDGANGLFIVPAVGKGYAGSRGGKSVVILDLTSSKSFGNYAGVS